MTFPETVRSQRLKSGRGGTSAPERHPGPNLSPRPPGSDEYRTTGGSRPACLLPDDEEQPVTLFNRDKPTRRQAELDDMVKSLTAAFTQQLDSVVDELYSTLSIAYPGLYPDPDAEESTVIEYRVTETTGQKRIITPPAAVAAHRAGLLVERRKVTSTEWEAEPNPNHRTQLRPVFPPATIADAIEAASDGDHRAITRGLSPVREA